MMEGFCIQVCNLWMVHWLNKEALMSLCRLGFIVDKSVCPNMGTSQQILMAMEFQHNLSQNLED
jgi:hypothetical protein